MTDSVDEIVWEAFEHFAHSGASVDEDRRLIGAVRRAAENTKRWLMGRVCARCGTTEAHEIRESHLLCPNSNMISTGLITRAEHLYRTGGLNA